MTAYQLQGIVLTIGVITVSAAFAFAIVFVCCLIKHGVHNIVRLAKQKHRRHVNTKRAAEALAEHAARKREFSAFMEETK